MALRATQGYEDSGAAGGADTVVATARRIRPLTVVLVVTTTRRIRHERWYPPVSTKTVLPSARASKARRPDKGDPIEPLSSTARQFRLQTSTPCPSMDPQGALPVPCNRNLR